MKATLGRRLHYAFDNTLSKGTPALLAWLFLLCAGLVLGAALIVLVTGIAPEKDGGGQLGFVELAWMALMRTLDAGTMGGDTGSWPFLFAMLGITFGGIFFVSTLIGLITSGIEERLAELRKGRSMVVEQGHSVILGWSPQIFTVLSELVEANASRGRACIAVLAPKDKVEMDDEIRARLPRTGGTRIVTRSGHPMDMADLELVSPHTARAIVVLSPETEEPDAEVIKTILAITNNPRRRKERYHVVAELRERRNLEVARMVGGQEAQVVLAPDLIARLTVQTCRQSGLSVVYTELLDFGGDEIYFQPEPRLAGKAFGEALLAYEDSTVIGLRKADGRVLLNPPMDGKIEAGDAVIAISQDDDTVRLAEGPRPPVDSAAIRPARPRPALPERTLVLGWNERGPLILQQLDAYVAPGSTATVVSISAPEDLPEGLQNLTVVVETGDPSERAVLDRVAAAGHDHVLVLSPGQQPDAQRADSETLITLLHLRDIADRSGREMAIVSEMRDVRNRELAEVTKADDFIVSDRLISLLLAQVAENRDLMALFEDLFDPEGSEIYLKPATDYVEPGRSLSYATVVEAARQRGECAIGYRLKAHEDDPAKAYGVRVNPPKSERLSFAEGDRVVVVAES